MYLTHLDERGMDSPPILIENSTAANRAVNIPEFVNIPPGGLLKIDAPAVEFYRVFDNAWELAEKGRFEDAVPEWRRALEMSPGDARVHMNLGLALAASGKAEEGIAEYRKALEIDPENPEIHLNLGVAWAGAGNLDEAVKAYGQALRLDPEYAEAGRFPDAVETARKAHAAAQAANQPALLQTIESRIAMYQAGTPLRLPR